MNTKKLLKGNFFRTFVLVPQSFSLPLQRQTKKTTKQKRVLFPGGRLHLNKYGADSLTVGAKRQTKNQIKTP